MLDSIVKLKSKVDQSRARRRYQKKLPDQLTSLYGHRDRYTPTQITIAIRKAGLPVKHRKLAYEMYLTKEELKTFYDNSRKRTVTQPLPTITLKNSSAT